MSTVSPGPVQHPVIEQRDRHIGAATSASPPAAYRLNRLLRAVRKFREAMQYRLSCYVLSHLRLLKIIFAVLRVVRPVMIVRNTLVVTKAAEVREVLERFDDFILGESIELGMPWGPFLMTVDWREQHACERQMLQSVVKPATDLDTIRAIAKRVCSSRIEALAAKGRIDVVRDLAEPVMVSIFADYFGVPPLAGDERCMASAMRHLAGIIMVNPPVGSQAWFDSRDDIAGLTRQLLEQLTAERSKGCDLQSGAAVETLLARLIRRHNQPPCPNWFDEDWIRRYLTGLIATGGATIVRGTAHAVDQMLQQPSALPRAKVLSDELDGAEAGNRSHLSVGNGSSRDQLEVARDRLRQCIYEALRFRPMLPLLVRDCPRDTIIANGTSRVRLVPAGTRVIAPPLAAMFDAEAFASPGSFRERSLESYLHFGFGPRHCFGKYIADIAMLEIVHALMRLPELARASGSAGQVRYEGPAPNSLVVTFAAFNSGRLQ